MMMKTTSRPTPGRLFAALGSAVAVVVALAAPGEARATDFYAQTSIEGGASTWPDDPIAGLGIRSGFEFLEVISVEGMARLGYGPVDQRLLMLVGVGTRLSIPIAPFTPFARVGFIHQHETPVSAIDHDAFGHVMGVGDGIRHRFGFETHLGLNATFAKKDKTAFQVEGSGFMNVFPDDRGPLLYAGATVAFAVELDL